MSDSLIYIRKYYAVPAEVGRRVMVGKRAGVIANGIDQYIGVLFDTEKPNNILPCHPTYMVEYLEMGPVRPMTISQKRYRAWLYADSDLSFGEWLKEGGMERYA